MVGVVKDSSGNIQIVAVGTQGPQGPQGPAGGSGGSYTNATPVPVTVGGVEAGTTFDDVAVTDVLTDLFYPDIQGTVSLSINPGAGVREFGDIITQDITLTANITTGSTAVTNIEFRRGAGVLQSTPADIDYTETVDVDDDTTFTVEITDGVGTDSSSRTYNFVYPFYWGVDVKGLTGPQIRANFTTQVTTQGTKSFTSSPVSQAFYFAYPSVYGVLSDIKDPNTNLSYFSDFTERSVSITGLDATSQTYRVYEFDYLTTQTDFTLTFTF